MEAAEAAAPEMVRLAEAEMQARAEAAVTAAEAAVTVAVVAAEAEPQIQAIPAAEAAEAAAQSCSSASCSRI